MTGAGESPARRPVRSYVIRSGRLSASQRRAIDQYSSRYVIEFEPKPLELERCFVQDRPLVVEIGFGSGETLLEMALVRPDANFLGIDVYRPGVGRVLRGIVRHGLENIRLICHDAVEVFAENLADDSADCVLILFPDPWPRKRHHKRRLVREDFMRLVLRKLKPGGEAHLATDWAPYFEWMKEVMGGISEFSPACHIRAGSPSAGGDAPGESPRSPTRFERRGRALGHEVLELVYRKVAP